MELYAVAQVLVLPKFVATFESENIVGRFVFPPDTTLLLSLPTYLLPPLFFTSNSLLYKLFSVSCAYRAQSRQFLNFRLDAYQFIPLSILHPCYT